MIDVLIKGGPVMVPLLLCSILTLAISFERIYYLLRNTSDPERALQAVTLAVEHGKIADAVNALTRSRGPIGALTTAALSSYGKGREELEAAIRVAGDQEIYKMERRVSVLGMMVSVAPLLGILGTVLGIIKSFGILAQNPVLLEAGALSGGIAEALITTAAGLIIAIPALALHTYIVGIIDRRIAEMNEFSQELVELLSGSGVSTGAFSTKGKQTASH